MTPCRLTQAFSLHYCGNGFLIGRIKPMWVLLVVFVVTSGNSVTQVGQYERKGFKTEETCRISGRTIAKEHSYTSTMAIGEMMHGKVKISFSCDYM
jgi:hypothetical protein